MDDQNISITISQEGAQSLYDMKNALIETQERIIKANEDLKKTLDNVRDDLGVYQYKIEEVVTMTTKASDNAGTAFGTLASKLGKIADWIMSKIS